MTSGSEINVANISDDVAPVIESIRAQATACPQTKDPAKIENEINDALKAMQSMKSAPLRECQAYGTDAKITCDPTKIKIISSRDRSSVEVFTGTVLLMDSNGSRTSSPSQQMKACANALRAEKAHCIKPDHAKALQIKINTAPAVGPTGQAVQ